MTPVAKPRCRSEAYIRSALRSGFPKAAVSIDLFDYFIAAISNLASDPLLLSFYAIAGEIEAFALALRSAVVFERVGRKRVVFVLIVAAG